MTADGLSHIRRVDALLHGAAADALAGEPVERAEIGLRRSDQRIGIGAMDFRISNEKRTMKRGDVR